MRLSYGLDSVAESAADTRTWFMWLRDGNASRTMNNKGAIKWINCMISDDIGKKFKCAGELNKICQINTESIGFALEI